MTQEKNPKNVPDKFSLTITDKTVINSQAILNADLGGVSSHCPIALALREKFNDSFRVGYHTAHLDEEVFLLPRKASQFISAFDFSRVSNKPLKTKLPLKFTVTRRKHGRKKKP